MLGQSFSPAYPYLLDTYIIKLSQSIFPENNSVISILHWFDYSSFLYKICICIVAEMCFSVPCGGRLYSLWRRTTRRSRKAMCEGEWEGKKQRKKDRKRRWTERASTLFGQQFVQSDVFMADNWWQHTVCIGLEKRRSESYMPHASISCC